MNFDLKFVSEIVLEGLPRPWTTKFELYYPDLAGYPIVYVHYIEEQRVFGFPSAVNFSDRDEEHVDAHLTFVSNVKIDSTNIDRVKNELMERFGVINKVGWTDVEQCCKDPKYVEFFKQIWEITESMNGEYLPYGRFYEELYSIVRFVSAWQPKTGRQSEMRMVYNFMSIFGENCKFVGEAAKWSHLDFFIIPTFKETINETLDDFPKYKSLHSAMSAVWGEESEQQSTSTVTISSLKRGWPAKKEQFMRKITNPLVDQSVITSSQKHDIDRLVDTFNRNGTRASFFVWSAMSAKERNYETWDKDFFVEFYTKLSEGRGIAPKVVACFLQQGFGNEECIPIDTWVETFHKYALGISDQKKFFDSFNKMGKLERVIWIASQANKTNIVRFFDSLWCTRYGNNGNRDFREANPISCYECKLNKTCMGYDSIKREKVHVQEESLVEVLNVLDFDEDEIKKMEEKILESIRKEKKHRERVDKKEQQLEQLESQLAQLQSASTPNPKIISSKIKNIEETTSLIQKYGQWEANQKDEQDKISIRIEDKKKIIDQKITDSLVLQEVEENDCKFICLTVNKVPKKIFMPRIDGENTSWNLVDEFSGYLLENQKSSQVGCTVTVEEFYNSLPDPSQFVFRQIQ